MKMKATRIMTSWMTVILISLHILMPMAVNAKETESREVATSQELIRALYDAEALETLVITITQTMTIGEETAQDGRMLPVEIPGGVTLQGAGDDVELFCRSPLQLTGDNVTFKDMNLRFESTDALGSVPHREIFLAGHSLVLDNVDTYLEGSGGSLGGFGGTEDELLPTIYAGGFEGTTVSDNAELIIRNANEHTILDAVYMGHGAESDAKEAYTGKAALSISAKTVVRNGIYVTQNLEADICVTGPEYSNLTSPAFYGNEKTNLRIERVSVNNATIDGVGYLELDDDACLMMVSGSLNHIDLKNGACLDVSRMGDVVMEGNLTGGNYDLQSQEDSRGVLVLNEEGSLQINGDLSGTTFLHAKDRNYPGEFTDGKAYVTVSGMSSEDGFVLPDSKRDYYELEYSGGTWNVYASGGYGMPLIGDVEIISCPQQIEMGSIVGSSLVPAENAPYCSVVWKDENGNAYSPEEVADYLFYANDMVIAMRKDYWEETAYDETDDWEIPVCLTISGDSTSNYYFYMESGQTPEPGTYVFLFCNEYFDSLGNVADVKEQLGGKVMATMEVVFTDGTVSGNNPGEKPGDDSTDDSEEEEIPENPPHTHEKVNTQLMQATFGKDGSIKKVCEGCGQVLSVQVICAPKTVQLSKKKYTYSGKLCKPKVIVKDRTGKVLDSTQYTVTYANNKKVGQATVTVTMRGNYSGSQKTTFTVVPKKTSISKTSSNKKKFTVKWKKVTSQISGYQIQYSTSKKFTKKTTKSVYIKNKKTTGKTIKKPKRGRKYYVRIRTYKTVKVNGKMTKLYSDWSKVKKV